MSTFRALACGPRQRGTANSELKLSKPPKAAWRGRRRPVAGCGGRERPGDRASPSPPQRLCTAPARGGRERPGDRASPSPRQRLGTALARPVPDTAHSRRSKGGREGGGGLRRRRDDRAIERAHDEQLGYAIDGFLLPTTQEPIFLTNAALGYRRNKGRS